MLRRTMLKGVAAIAASFVNLIQGFPFVHKWMESRLGPATTGMVANGLYIVIQTFADFPLGLILSLVEAITFLNEVTARVKRALADESAAANG